MFFSKMTSDVWSKDEMTYTIAAIYSLDIHSPSHTLISAFHQKSQVVSENKVFDFWEKSATTYTLAAKMTHILTAIHSFHNTHSHTLIPQHSQPYSHFITNYDCW